MYVDSDSEEEGFEPDERENYRVTRPDLVEARFVLEETERANEKEIIFIVNEMKKLEDSSMLS